MNQEYDVYIPDHRGTGRSSFLQCTVGSPSSPEPTPVKQCFEQLKNNYGVNGLIGFGTSAAATDVVYTFNITKSANDKLVV